MQETNQYLSQIREQRRQINILSYLLYQFCPVSFDDFKEFLSGDGKSFKVHAGKGRIEAKSINHNRVRELENNYFEFMKIKIDEIQEQEIKGRLKDELEKHLRIRERFFTRVRTLVNYSEFNCEGCGVRDFKENGFCYRVNKGRLNVYTPDKNRKHGIFCRKCSEQRFCEEYRKAKNYNNGIAIRRK